MNEAQAAAALSPWLWIGAVLTVVVHLIAIGLVLHRFGQWVGRIEATLRNLNDTLRQVDKDSRTVHKRVDEHDVILMRHGTVLEQLAGGK